MQQWSHASKIPEILSEWIEWNGQSVPWVGLWENWTCKPHSTTTLDGVTQTHHAVLYTMKGFQCIWTAWRIWSRQRLVRLALNMTKRSKKYFREGRLPVEPLSQGSVRPKQQWRSGESRRRTHTSALKVSVTRAFQRHGFCRNSLDINKAFAETETNTGQGLYNGYYFTTDIITRYRVSVYTWNTVISAI